MKFVEIDSTRQDEETFEGNIYKIANQSVPDVLGGYNDSVCPLNRFLNFQTPSSYFPWCRGSIPVP